MDELNQKYVHKVLTPIAQFLLMTNTDMFQEPHYHAHWFQPHVQLYSVLDQSGHHTQLELLY